jgi:hypothetical protein
MSTGLDSRVSHVTVCTIRMCWALLILGALEANSPAEGVAGQLPVTYLGLPRSQGACVVAAGKWEGSVGNAVVALHVTPSGASIDTVRFRLGVHPCAPYPGYGFTSIFAPSRRIGGPPCVFVDTLSCPMFQPGFVMTVDFPDVTSAVLTLDLLYPPCATACRVFDGVPLRPVDVPIRPLDWGRVKTLYRR